MIEIEQENQKVLHKMRKDMGGAYMHAVFSLCLKTWLVHKNRADMHFFIGVGSLGITHITVKYSRVTELYTVEYFKKSIPRQQKHWPKPVEKLTDISAEKLRESLMGWRKLKSEVINYPLSQPMALSA